MSCRVTWRGVLTLIGVPSETSWVPFLASLLPLGGALLVAPAARISERVRDRVAFGVSLATFLLVCALYPAVRGGGTAGVSFPSVMAPFGLSFRADLLSFTLGLITALIWVLVSVYSWDYMLHEGDQTRFYTFLLLTLGGCLGTVMAGDLITLYLFFELMSLAAFVLVVHDGTPRAMRAGYLYLLMTIGGALALFFGIIVVHRLTGGVALVAPGTLQAARGLPFAAFVAFLIGFGMKAGLVPLHIWLPEAHPVAPSPASALLSGIMIKLGAYGLIRVVYNLFDPLSVGRAGWNQLLLVLAAVTTLWGSVLAIAQTDLKRRLAYSSIGQMGYVLIGLALLNGRALTGDVFHILSHAVMKSCLFLTSGAIILRTGRRTIGELNGVAREMPVTLGAFTAAALAMIGIPPFNGFLSKWIIGLGALDAGRPAYTVVLLLSSFLNAVYYFPIVVNAYFKPPADAAAPRKEVGYAMLVPMVTLAVLTVLFDVIPRNLPLELAQATAAAVFKAGGGPL